MPVHTHLVMNHFSYYNQHFVNYTLATCVSMRTWWQNHLNHHSLHFGHYTFATYTSMPHFAVPALRLGITWKLLRPTFWIAQPNRYGLGLPIQVLQNQHFSYCALEAAARAPCLKVEVFADQHFSLSFMTTFLVFPLWPTF